MHDQKERYSGKCAIQCNLTVIWQFCGVCIDTHCTWQWDWLWMSIWTAHSVSEDILDQSCQNLGFPGFWGKTACNVARSLGVNQWSHVCWCAYQWGGSHGLNDLQHLSPSMQCCLTCVNEFHWNSFTGILFHWVFTGLQIWQDCPNPALKITFSR